MNKQECDYMIRLIQSKQLGISVFSVEICASEDSVRSANVWWERVPEAGGRSAESS